MHTIVYAPAEIGEARAAAERLAEERGYAMSREDVKRVMENIDARLVAEYLGHANLSTVSRDAHVASEELHAATQALADGPREDRSPSSPRTASGASGRDLGIHPEQLAAWD